MTNPHPRGHNAPSVSRGSPLGATKETMSKTLVVTEKKSVADDFAKVNKVPKKGDMSFENDRFVIAWASGHLLELKSPDAYDK